MVTIYKNRAETPLEALERLRQLDPQLENAKLAYAGRLDPLAEGMLLVLVNEECKQRDDFQKLDKIYEFDLLAGIATDSGDALGLITDFSPNKLDKEVLEKVVPTFTCTITQTPPVYSAVIVEGKPLFWWANERRLSEIEIPTREVLISQLELLEEYTLSTKEILSQLSEDFAKLKGDFRTMEIQNSWEETLKRQREFQVFKLRANVGSGTYIRSLAQDLGKAAGIPALAWRIKRTQVGEFSSFTF